MFFKKIEMTGFKSFANRTEVIFKPGVTVIVGPNGCGKSNIFDAVRWVLGEQSAKSLRGGKMGDVIFSGSATHRPTAFAHVTLTVSNEDRRLPLDFNEIVIGRRLMRTGESEYMINRQTCRLRDILELFMDTGVGTNAYSIMEQGRIDQIINARPIDRREIFEEAAGISKYRARRQEAQRRLGRTEDDLIRLADIIAEVKRQATSLKRQANRAERYKRLSGELQALEKRLLAHRWRTHREEGRDLRENLSRDQDRLAEVSARLGQLEQAHESQMERSEGLNREIMQLSSQVNEKTAAIHTAEQRVSLLRQRTEFNANRALTLSQEVKENSHTLEEVQREVERVTTEFTEREGSFEQRRQAHAERQAEYDRVRQGLDQHERSLTEVRRDLGDHRTAQINLENEIRLAVMMGEKFNDELDVLTAQHEEAEGEHREALSRREERERAHTEAAAALREITERLETLEGRLEDLQEEEAEVREAAKSSEGDLQTLRSRLSALRDLQRSHEGYREGVRRILQAVESGEIPQIAGTVASSLRPQHGHEVASEAALSGGEQVILARTAADRDAALRWLRDQGEGRATLLALGEDVALDRDESLANRDEAIAWADALIDCPDEMRPAARLLLGTTLVARDLQSALRLSREPSVDRCVTPEGEVAVSGVLVTGGRFESTGLLTREREITELAERGDRLEAEVDDLRRRLETLANTRQEAEVERREVQARRQRQEITCAELAKDHEMARREEETIRETLERLDHRITDLKRKIEEQIDNRGHASERLDETRAEIASLEERLTAMEGESVSTGAEARRLGEEVQAMAIEVASARERLENLRLRKERAEAQREELETRLTSARQEIAKLDEENDRSKAEIAEIEANLETLFEERRQMEAKVTDQQGASDQTGMEVRRLGQEIHVITRERNELQNQVQSLEVKRAQHDMQLQHCDEEAQEKFNTPMSDILAAHPEDEIEDPDALRSEASEMRQRLAAMGPVNVIAIEEYEQLKERQEFLSTQEADLLEAQKDLEETIAELDKTSTRIFTDSFTRIRESFQATFRRLFGGGKADLVALDPDNLVESGIDIIAMPPGKKLQSISLLSGGEKALTAIALLFGIFQQRPAPFCVLDEIDAPLDDKNVGRFKDMLLEFSKTTQFIIITHNKLTMQLADALFGITMEEPGVSRLVGVDIRTAERFAA